MSRDPSNLHKHGFQDVTPLEEAIGKFFPLFPQLSAEIVSLDKALERCAANDIRAPNNVPPFRRSAMDGFAIRAEDSFSATPTNPKPLEIIGSIQIGEFKEIDLDHNQAVEVATGAPVPVSSTAVIKVEETKVEGSTVQIFNNLPPGKNIAPAGEDIAEGRVVLEAGTIITGAHVGLLAACGVPEISVRCIPRVIILGTGDELVPPTENLSPGKIHESNTVMTSVLLDHYGARVVETRHLPDDLSTIEDAIQSATQTADLVLCSGGTSVGRKDFLPQAVAELGEIIVHGVGQKPGSPVLLGRIHEKPVICLPGFPVANYIGIMKIAGPLIRHLQGAKERDPRKMVFGVLAKRVSAKGFGFINHLRVKLEETATGYQVHPVKLAGSGILRSITESDGFVEIPANCEGFEKGEVVKVYLHL